MYKDAWENRYAPGKRRNSFFMDMPCMKDESESSEILEKLVSYVFYYDETINRVVQEEIEP